MRLHIIFPSLVEMNFIFNKTVENLRGMIREFSEGERGRAEARSDVLQV